VFNPSATVKGLSQYLWKRSSRRTPSPTLLHGVHHRVGTAGPWNVGQFYGSSYFVDPRGNFLATGMKTRTSWS